MNAKTSVFFFSLFLLIGISQSTQAATVSFSPSNTTVSIGEMFSLDVVGTGFADSLFGGGIDLTFDSSVINIIGTAINTSVFEFEPKAGDFDNVAGTLVDTGFNTFNPPAATDFHFMTISFIAVGAGLTDLMLSESPNFGFFDKNVSAIGGAITFNNGQVSVVPVPAAFWLMGSALFGVFAVGQSKQAKK
ncbi:MAG: hypothetical protein H6963_06610 [Chromatiaceae bacterium]|nr:hypothetical protein [Chromatiaceae bacterium]